MFKLVKLSKLILYFVIVFFIPGFFNFAFKLPFDEVRQFMIKAIPVGIIVSIIIVKVEELLLKQQFGSDKK